MRTARGFTIAETMVVAVILGMMLTAIAAATAPLLGSPERAQAKSDSLGPAAAGMFLLERDLRESNVAGVFACVSQTATCGDGGLGGAGAIVLPTALTSGDWGSHFQTIDALPDWQGFIVYWLAGASGIVYRAFEPEKDLAKFIYSNPPDRAALQTLANAAAAAAMGEASPSIAMRNVSALSVSVDLGSSITSLHVVSTGSADGNTNTSTFDDDVMARN